jgi:protein-S-isoprenylcysteine O-methyltransferase Ste14
MMGAAWSLRLYYLNILSLLLNLLLYRMIKAERMVGPGTDRAWGAGFWIVLAAGWAITWLIPVGIDMAFWTGLGAIASGEAVLGLSYRAMRAHPEKKRALVDWGIYRFSRHPQSLGSLLCLFGVVAAGWNAAPAMYAILCAYFAGYVVFSHFQILSEEKANLQRFGPEYKEYMDRTPRYLGLPGSGTGGKRY